LTISAHKKKTDGISENFKGNKNITLALPALLYGSENWTITARDSRRMTAAEIKYTRKTAGCTWTDYKTNTHTGKELNITPVLDKILEYKEKKVATCKQKTSY